MFGAMSPRRNVSIFFLIAVHYANYTQSLLNAPLLGEALFTSAMIEIRQPVLISPRTQQIIPQNYLEAYGRNQSAQNHSGALSDHQLSVYSSRVQRLCDVVQ
jgi:hypothetical protein